MQLYQVVTDTGQSFHFNNSTKPTTVGCSACIAATEESVKRVSLSHVEIPVNCECRMPDSREEMVGYDRCDRWFHFSCAGFDVPPPGDWFCKHCSQD